MPEKPRIEYSIEDRGYKSPCWIWQGCLSNDGYGMAYDRKRSIPAHRMMYFRLKGAIPRKAELDHLCRVRLCVNPEHLEIVTHSENMRRIRDPRTQEQRIADIMAIPALRVIAEIALKNRNKENQDES